jgi:predicted nucleic acid-binding Zn ribbon protein
MCSEEQASIGIDSAHGDRRATVLFYLILALGFILGFWSVWGVLIFKNAWMAAFLV